MPTQQLSNLDQENFTNSTIKAQYNESFYTRAELEQIGFKSLGENVLISRLARFYAPHKISIGNCVRIDDFAILSGAVNLGSYIHISAQATMTGGNGVDSSITMGDFCSLSLGSKILSVSDDLSSGVLVNSCIPDMYRNVKYSHVCLNGHNHIAAMSLVLPNTIFEEGANLGPQSLVGDKTLQGFGYYFGAPARLFSHLDSEKLKNLESRFLDSLLTINGGGAVDSFLGESNAPFAIPNPYLFRFYNLPKLSPIFIESHHTSQPMRTAQSA